MAEINVSVGDRVSFRVGRGYAVGSIVNKADDMVSIRTTAGKVLNRKVCAIAKMPADAVTEDASLTSEAEPAAETEKYVAGLVA